MTNLDTHTHERASAPAACTLLLYQLSNQGKAGQGYRDVCVCMCVSVSPIAHVCLDHPVICCVHIVNRDVLHHARDALLSTEVLR